MARSSQPVQYRECVPTAHSIFKSWHKRCLLLALHRVARDGDSSCDCFGYVTLLEPSVMQRTGIGAPSQVVRIGELRAVEEVMHPCVQLQRPPGRTAATMWSERSGFRACQLLVGVGGLAESGVAFCGGSFAEPIFFAVVLTLPRDTESPARGERGFLPKETHTFTVGAAVSSVVMVTEFPPGCAS